eukprot:SAG11_NODE_7_length_31267_cov_19.541966_6_plen_142_part_00
MSVSRRRQSDRLHEWIKVLQTKVEFQALELDRQRRLRLEAEIVVQRLLPLLDQAITTVDKARDEAQDAKLQVVRTTAHVGRLAEVVVNLRDVTSEGHFKMPVERVEPEGRGAFTAPPVERQATDVDNLRMLVKGASGDVKV